MIAGLLAGCLAAAVMSVCRVRPDHRLRDATPAPTDRRSFPRPRLHRSRRPGPEEIAGWCDALARDVRSGASLGAALRSVGPPDGTSLVVIPHALARGRPLADALTVTTPSPDEHAALTVLTACAHHGGPAAQPLDQVAATLRRRAADAAERAVHSAQARLSALVMTVLPGAVLVLLLTTSPSTRATTGSPFGVAVVVLGLGLNLLGWVWMRRIIAGGPR
jgi:tight adherence protein B